MASRNGSMSRWHIRNAALTCLRKERKMDLEAQRSNAHGQPETDF